MGHQVNFYLDPNDTADIEKELRGIEPLVILHSRSTTSKPRAVGSLSFEENNQPWLFFYLVRPTELSSVKTNHVPAQGYWTIDVIESPVVEFTRCFFDGKILRRGRVHYVDGFYRPDGSWAAKSEQFEKWAKSVLSRTKRALKKQGAHYIGPSTEKWIQSGNGKLVT